MSNKNIVYIKGYHSKILLVIIMFITKIMLELFYTFLVSPIYAYEGMIDKFNLVKYLISWILYIMIVYFLMKVNNKLYKFFLHFEFIITILPILICYSLADKENAYMLYVFICFLLQVFILMGSNKKQKKYSCYFEDMQKKYSYVIIPIILAVIVIVIRYNGFHGLKAFDTVYLYDEIRSKTQYPPLFSYLVMWTRIVFIPFFIVYTIYKKKYLKTLFFIFLQLLLYMGTGAKFTYLIVLVIIATYILSKARFMLYYMYLGLILLISFIFLVKYRFIVSFLGERFLFGPAINKFWYYDFFSRYPKIYFSDTIFGKVLGLYYQYTHTSGQLIFSEHFRDKMFDSNSITGVFGESYAQLGFLGMLFFSVIIAYFIKIISKTSEGLDISIKCAMLSIFIVLMNDAGFLTIFFSGGLFIIIFLFHIFLDKEKVDSNIIIKGYRIKDLKDEILKNYKFLIFGIVIFMFISLFLSPISYEFVSNNYNLYLTIGDIEFNKLIFIKIIEDKSTILILIYSIFFGLFLFMYFIIINFFIKKIKGGNKKNGEN